MPATGATTSSAAGPRSARRRSTAPRSGGRPRARSRRCPAGPGRSTSTSSPCSARAAARFTVVVVLPTPPFWLATVSTRVCGRRGSGSPTRPASTRSAVSAARAMGVSSTVSGSGTPWSGPTGSVTASSFAVVVPLSSSGFGGVRMEAGVTGVVLWSTSSVRSSSGSAAGGNVSRETWSGSGSPGRPEPPAQCRVWRMFHVKRRAAQEAREHRRRPGPRPPQPADRALRTAAGVADRVGRPPQTGGPHRTCSHSRGWGDGSRQWPAAHRPGRPYAAGRVRHQTAFTGAVVRAPGECLRRPGRPGPAARPGRPGAPPPPS